MSPPSTKELKGAIVDILSHARDDGRLSQLTVRIVRQELATRFGLEEEVLNSGKHKSFIKDTVHATVDNLQNASDDSAEPHARKVAKKEKSDDQANAGPRKHKSKARVQPSDEKPPEEANNSPQSKKASARSKPSKSDRASKKPESGAKFKSKAIIESSDEETVPESRTLKPVRSPKKVHVLTKSSPVKQKQQRASMDDSDIEIDTGEGPGPSRSRSKPRHAIESPKTSKAKEVTRDPLESELSSVIDEPPKKRQKNQEKESVKPQRDEKKRGKKKEALSKDDETISRLKSIVIACGVRKVWKKEFEGLDKPSQQIKRLHAILGDLGMTPRYSLEKAKAIRAQRELAQELKDVQEFEKATTRRGKGVRNSSEAEESADQSNSDAGIPTRKKNAQASIMAFLQDQSEEE